MKTNLFNVRLGLLAGFLLYSCFFLTGCPGGSTPCTAGLQCLPSGASMDDTNWMATVFEDEYGDIFPQVGTTLTAIWDNSWPSNPFTGGSTADQTATSDDTATVRFIELAVPAHWEFYWPACDNLTSPSTLIKQWNTAIASGTDYCSVTPSLIGLSVSPSTINIASPPPTATITSSVANKFSTSGGMPQVQYLDENGVIVGSVTATSVTNSGSTIQVTTPNVSSVPTATYGGLGGNVYGQSFSPVGLGVVYVISASVSPKTLSFATQMEGTSSAAKTVTFTNNGSQAMALASVQAADAEDFDVVQNNCSSVAAGGSCTVTVKFTPQTTGSLSSTLVFTTSDGGIITGLLTGTSNCPIKGCL